MDSNAMALEIMIDVTLGIDIIEDGILKEDGPKMKSGIGNLFE